MRTQMLIFDVKGQHMRTHGGGGQKWLNFADALYGWPLITLYKKYQKIDYVLYERSLSKACS